MDIKNNWLLISLAWIAVTTVSFALYVKYDWNKTLQQYEHDFNEYRLEQKAFKLAFRRTPSPDYMWQIKYIVQNTNHTFNPEEIDCLKDDTTCSKEQRDQLCVMLQSSPNISDCKTIKQMRDEFIILNKYMDNRLPPVKPTFDSYLDQHKQRHIIFALITIIPVVLLGLLRIKK